MSTPASCANCNITGLPILPVRYTVLPAELQPTLPGEIGQERIKEIALDRQQYQYGLRTLRGGVLYLFYEQGPRGKNYWQVFSVTHDGRISIMSPGPEPEDKIACANINHSVPRTAYICIESPEKCGKVWIAFSEHLWSGETYVQYTTDAALRAKRMQLIEPALWINNPKNPHATEATPAALEHVIEYRPHTPRYKLSPTKLDKLSLADGRHYPWVLVQQSTRYPAAMRNAINDDKGRPIEAESKTTVKLMHRSGLRPDGGSHPPMLLALWDAIGIAHELNGYRNEAAGRIKQYGDERELEITALAAIEGAKKALADKAESWVETKEQLFKDRRQLDPAYLRTHAMSLPQPQQALRLDDLSLLEQWNAQEVPTAYGQRLNNLISLYQRGGWQDPKSLPAMVAQRDQTRNQISREVDEYLRTRDPNKQAAINQARADSWPKYEKKLDLAKLDTFKANYDKFLAEADQLIDKRTVELIKWLEAPLFIDTLEDYHQTNIRDGVLFEVVIGEAIFGMTSSHSGAVKIKGWSQGSKVEKTNLVLRALALNQAEGKDALNVLLTTTIETASTPLTETAAAIITGISKHLAKLSDMTKKSLSLWNANHKEGVKKVNARGLEKIFMTANEYLFLNKGLSQKVDSVGLAIMRATVLVRTGADYAKTINLLLAEARLAVKAKEETKLILAMGVAVAGKKASAVKQELSNKWKELLQADNLEKPGGAFNEAFEMRFAVVTALLQVVYVTTLMAENSSDPKKQSELLAAKYAMGGGMADLIATTLKGVVGENALSFQSFKVAGGVLSGVAAFVTVDQGIDSTATNWQKERYGLSILYGARSTTDFLAGGAAFLATFSYAAPTLVRVGTRYPNSFFAKGIAARGASLFAGRAWLFMWALRLNLLSLAITVVIWIFSDNDLENWVEECAFSKGSPEDRFKDAQTQMKAFGQALKSVI